jgi:hypothetical protein
MLAGAKAAAPLGAAYGAGASEAGDLSGVAGDAAMGGLGAGLLGGAVPAVGAGVRRLAAPLAGKLGRMAESAAVRATNADRTATRRALKGSDQARHELGRFLLDEPTMKLRSPQAIREAAQEIQATEGPKIGALAAQADNAVNVDLAKAITDAKNAPAVAALNRNTVTRPHYDQIVKMLDEQQQTLAGQRMGYASPSQVHNLRVQLDALAKWDRTAPEQTQEAWRAARKAIDQHLDAAMKKAGLADEWGSANARFSATRKLTNPKTKRGLADIGVERREGNRWGSPSEKGAGLLGGISAAMGNPVAAVAIPATTVALNRFGMPVTARTADALSGALGRLSSLSVPPSASTASAVSLSPEVEALLRAMRGRPGLAPAAAEEDAP